MKPVLRSQNFLHRILEKTGGWYITIVIVFVQLTASTTLFIGFIAERINANYSPQTLALITKTDGIAVPIVFVFQTGIVIFLARNLRASLTKWKHNKQLFEPENYPESWKASHTLVWKYAFSTALSMLGLIVLPKILLLNSIKSATKDQVIYGLIAGLVSTLAFVPLSAVILDKFLIPVRQILLPKDFSQQLSGLSKLKILEKTLAVVFFSLVVTALLIAPIGYHQTTRALNEIYDSREVLFTLQVQSIAVSSLAILFAFGLTYLFAKSISDPLSKLMDSFNRVENGDMNTRAPVISSDEISQLAVYFNRMVSRLQELQKDLEDKVIERTSQLKAINEVGRVATSILDSEKLLQQVVVLISKELGYYYSAVYLMDTTGRWCELKAATGEAGRVLKESKHQIEINNSSAIGKSIRSRQPQISSGMEDKTTRLNNPLLPYTRSEISLPLIVGNQILGAIDLHSTQEAAFEEQDIETLQNMANQVAISLDNARLFQETRQRLNELRNIQKQYLREAWIDSSHSHGTFSLASDSNVEISDENLTDFPITLRDQVIGRIMLGTEGSLSVEDRNWVQAIATQAALALENARLLEESQSSAIREKIVTEITNKIWASTSLDSVLQTTIRELGQVLDATEATIELTMDENRGIS